MKDGVVVCVTPELSSASLHKHKDWEYRMRRRHDRAGPGVREGERSTEWSVESGRQPGIDPPPPPPLQSTHGLPFPTQSTATIKQQNTTDSCLLLTYFYSFLCLHALSLRTRGGVCVSSQDC
ncbi:hypothetical protein J6590_008485 [Homalodisca vitripennis]|nr:hypothetical protein J6590_008485 [Homalodisca vitripennis]